MFRKYLPFLFTIFFILTAFIPFWGLHADYFDTQIQTNSPVESSIVKYLHFDEHSLSGYFIKNGQFSIHFYGYIFQFSSGIVKFRLSAFDKATLSIDGKLLIKTFYDNRRQIITEGLILKRGFHKIDIKYFDDGGDFAFNLEKSHGENKFSQISQFEMYSSKTFFQWIYSAFALLVFILSLFYLLFYFYRMFQASKRSVYENILLIISALVVIILLTTLLSQMITHRQLTVHGCDTFGYLQAANDILKKGFCSTSFKDEAIPILYNSYTYRPNKKEITFFQGPHAYYIIDFLHGILVNQYPPGFPIVLAIVKTLFNESSVFYLNILVALVFFIISIFFWGRKGKFGIGAIVGFTFLSQSIIFEHSIILMSDLLSALILVLITIILVSGKKEFLRAIFAGSLIGFAILIRYSNVLFVIPLFVIEIFGKKRTISLFLSSIGIFLVGILPLGLYQKCVLGSFFQVTYPFTNVGKLSFANIPSGMQFYFTAIRDEFSSILLIMILIGSFQGWYKRKYRVFSSAAIVFIVVHFLFISSNGVLLVRYLVPIVPFALFFYGVFLEDALEFLKKCRIQHLKTVLVYSSFLLLLFQPILDHAKLPWGADRKPEEISWRISQITEPNARVLCDVLTGSLRIYGNRFGYRVSFISDELLYQSLHLLIQHHFPVYLAIDNPQLWKIKKKLEHRFKLTPIKTMIPFYKVSELEKKT